MSNIKCPHCNQDFEISQALSQQVEEQIAKKYQQTELELRQKNAGLEEKMQNFDLALARKLDAEKQKIVSRTTELLVEQQRLKEAEKDKIINDLKKSLEDAQRKATQGSQQLQGEVAELDLENVLRQAFPGDDISPVGKGVLGADISQTVKSPKGTNCGSILWESKRTKTWAGGWTSKLKEDMRVGKANLAAIVSEVVPEEVKSGIGLVDGVWTCLPKLALPLAMLLRKSLLDAARERAVSANQQDKAVQLYSYITSHEFVQTVESMVETYQEMLEQVNRERVAYEKSWKAREMHAQKLLSGVSGLYGSMQVIAGSALPQISHLELE